MVLLLDLVLLFDLVQCDLAVVLDVLLPGLVLDDAQLLLKFVDFEVAIETFERHVAILLPGEELLSIFAIREALVHRIFTFVDLQIIH